LRENKTQITRERDSSIKEFSIELAMGSNLDRKHVEEEEQEASRVSEVNYTQVYRVILKYCRGFSGL
jgi:hypothetical protein